MITICAVHNDAVKNMDEMAILFEMMPKATLKFRADWLYDSPDDVIHIYPREPFKQVTDRARKNRSKRVVFIGQPAKRLVQDAEWLTWYKVDDGMEIAFTPTWTAEFWQETSNHFKAMDFWKKAFNDGN